MKPVCVDLLPSELHSVTGGVEDNRAIDNDVRLFI
jgi:hypothetical protein